MSDDTIRLGMQKDLLWGTYADIRTHARHAETLRANAVNLVLVITSALIAVITSDGHVKRSELPISLVLILVGIIGSAFAASYTELYHRNRLRAEQIREVLNERHFSQGDPTIIEALKSSDDLHRATPLYRWTRRVTGSTHRFWLAIPVLSVGAGIVLSTLAV